MQKHCIVLSAAGPSSLAETLPPVEESSDQRERLLACVAFFLPRLDELSSAPELNRPSSSDPPTVHYLVLVLVALHFYWRHRSYVGTLLPHARSQRPTETS